MKLPVGKIICGDCLESMKSFPDTSIDLIFVDPPYVKEGIYLYEQIAREASRILKSGRFAVFYASDYWLDLTFPFMLKFLDYFYLFHKINSHQVGQLHPRKIFGVAKSILVFSKGKANSLNWVPNIVPKDKPEKHHRSDRWEQSIGDAYFFIKNFSNQGDVVLDPNVGSGTTCIAAERLGRKWIGIDIDKSQCEMSRKRIAYERRNPGFRIFK